MEINKGLKKLRGSMTQSELSKISGVDKAIISKIESGKMSGTLACHKKIAEALGLKLSEFYHCLEDGKFHTAEFCPGHEKRPGSYPDFMEVLTNLPFSKKILPLIITLQPQEKISLGETDKEVERFFMLLEGEIEIGVEGKFYYLKKDSKADKGDGLYSASSQAHSLNNSGHCVARALCISTPPVI